MQRSNAAKATNKICMCLYSLWHCKGAGQPLTPGYSTLVLEPEGRPVTENIRNLI